MNNYTDVLSAAHKLPAAEKARLLEDLIASLRRDLEDAAPEQKRSLAGLWKDVVVTPEDIDKTRREMWGNFPREDI